MFSGNNSFLYNSTTDVIQTAGLCQTGRQIISIAGGGTFVIPNNVAHIFLRGGGLLSSCTLTLPATNSTMDGKCIDFIANVAITLMTVKAGTGDTLADSAGGLGLGAFQVFGYFYDFPTKSWYRTK